MLSDLLATIYSGVVNQVTDSILQNLPQVERAVGFVLPVEGIEVDVLFFLHWTKGEIRIKQHRHSLIIGKPILRGKEYYSYNPLSGCLTYTAKPSTDFLQVSETSYFWTYIDPSVEVELRHKFCLPDYLFSRLDQARYILDPNNAVKQFYQNFLEQVNTYIKTLEPVVKLMSIIAEFANALTNLVKESHVAPYIAAIYVWKRRGPDKGIGFVWSPSHDNDTELYQLNGDTIRIEYSIGFNYVTTECEDILKKTFQTTNPSLVKKLPQWLLNTCGGD